MLVSSAWAGRGKKKTFKGYLVDVSCVTERASELGTLGIVHTKRCLQMPDCERSGYAVLTGDRKIIRFDAAGNQQAKQLIASSDRDKDYRIVVSGRVEKESIAVSELRLDQ
jgi:hypothetical protein